jgi:hypothetical protein
MTTYPSGRLGPPPNFDAFPTPRIFIAGKRV